MNSLAEQKGFKRPGLAGTSLVLLSILIAYPISGMILTKLVAGGRSIDPDFQWIDATVLPRLLAAQAVGQILVLGLPVFWLARRVTGSGAFERANLAWLGIGRRGGVRSLVMAATGILLLQPFLYSIVELQNLILPLLGEAGRDMLRDQTRLDLFIRKIAGGGSLSGFLAAAAVLVLTPAICEELFFRGFVQKSFAGILTPNKAVLLTGLVFALFHMELFNLVPLTLLGWYIGYIYVQSDDLTVPAVAHGTNNLAALVLIQVQARLGVTDSGTAASGLLVMWQWWVFVVLSLIVFFLLIRRFPERPASADADNTMLDRRS
ncbi:MAG: CPBP family intramembrane metalloprotease [Chlorobiaceae bacterium]|nr:CPBP family intramembrane metalloprotease [Chlorobiaceae bacterium]